MVCMRENGPLMEGEYYFSLIEGLLFEGGQGNTVQCPALRQYIFHFFTLWPFSQWYYK